MNPTAQRDSRFDDAENLLASLIGILSARIVASNGAIEEIHILAAPGYHPKQVVRNVESALRAGLGIDVDRRIVSVAQLRDEADEHRGNNNRGAYHTAAHAAHESSAAPDPVPEIADREDDGVQPGRLVFVDFEAVREAGRSATCQVVLRRDGIELTGSGTGPDTPSGRAEAAARAVFTALHPAEHTQRLELEGAAIVSAAGRNYVLVAAHGLDGRITKGLTGAALLLRSPEETAILASLQASNRWLKSA